MPSMPPTNRRRCHAHVSRVLVDVDHGDGAAFVRSTRAKHTGSAPPGHKRIFDTAPDKFMGMGAQTRKSRRPADRIVGEADRWGSGC